jgi:sulfite exporter TauE/SafE
MAIFVVLVGVLVVLGKGFELPLHRTFRKYVVDGGRGAVTAFLGFLIGISPCVPLVTILTYIACTVTNVFQGVAYALCFGIGTIVPVMVLGPLVGLLPEKVFKSSRHLRVFRTVCGGILILFGLQLLYWTWQVL